MSIKCIVIVIIINYYMNSKIITIKLHGLINLPLRQSNDMNNVAVVSFYLHC